MTRLALVFFAVLATTASFATAQLVHRGPWSGAITATTAEVRLLLNESRLTTLEVSDTKDFRQIVSFPQQARQPTERETLAHYSLRELTPDTTYHYRVKAGRVREYQSIGKFKTMPAAGTPASFRFAFASGNQTASEAGAFSEIRYQGPLFFMHLGNVSNETEVPDELGAWQDLYDRSLGSFTQAELYRNVPVVYTWDAFDSGQSAVHQAYRNYVPHYPLPADSPDQVGDDSKPALNPISQSFSVGRVKFIVLDTRTARTAPDDENPELLGEWQWRWLQQEITSAALRHPLIFIVSSVPFHVRKSVSGPDDHWGYYPAERARLETWLREEKISGVSIVSGNAGFLATAIQPNEPGHLNELQSGFIDLKREPAIGSWTDGPLLPAATEEFFGIVDVADNHTSIEVTFRGMNQHGHNRFTSTFSVPADPR